MIRTSSSYGRRLEFILPGSSGARQEACTCRCVCSGGEWEAELLAATGEVEAEEQRWTSGEVEVERETGKSDREFTERTRV